jgi:hypothetical protein
MELRGLEDREKALEDLLAPILPASTSTELRK